MSTDTIALVCAALALVIGLGALWHSRTNRRALLAILRDENHRARMLIDHEYRESMTGG